MIQITWCSTETRTAWGLSIVGVHKSVMDWGDFQEANSVGGGSTALKGGSGRPRVSHPRTFVLGLVFLGCRC